MDLKQKCRVLSLLQNPENASRRHQPSSWTLVSRWSTQGKDFVRPMFMFMGKTAGKMLHIPVKNSKNTGELLPGKPLWYIRRNEGLKVKSSSGNERTALPECKPKYFPCKPHKPPLWYKQVLETPGNSVRAVNQHQPGGCKPLTWLESGN